MSTEPDRHADDCPGHPVRGETYDSMPISYGYVCSACGRHMNNPEQLTWPSWSPVL